MEVKCTNPKNYALTEGNVYEVQNQEEGFYFVMNDNNLLRRYSTDLFTEVPTESTVEEILNSMVIQNMTLRYTLDGEVKTHPISYSFQEPNMSCGVRTFDGLSSIQGACNSLPNRDNLRDEAYKKIFSLFMSKCSNCAFIIVSDNVENLTMYDNRMQNAIESFHPIGTEAELNPNSSNDIRVYILKRADF